MANQIPTSSNTTHVATIVATGNAVTDTAALKAAVDYAELNPYTRIEIDTSSHRLIFDGDELALINSGNGYLLSTQPFTLARRANTGPHARILFQNDARWLFGSLNSSSAPFTSGTSFSVASAMTNAISDSGLFAGVSVGDFVSVWSDDEITDNIPHNYISSVGSQYPAQIVKVADKITSTVWFESLFADTYTTNANWKLLSLYKDFSIENIHFQVENATNLNANMLVFTECENVELNRCKWTHTGTKGTSGTNGSYVALTNCHDVKINECEIHNQWAEANLYGIGCFAGTNKVVVRNCRFTETRHAITSGGYDLTGDDRGGTPSNVRVEGCELFRSYTGLPSESGASLWGFDTHSEGWNWVFENNKCTIGQPATNNSQEIKAFLMRARNCTLKGNRVYGHSQCVGVDVQGKDCRVVDHYQRGGLHMVRTQPATDADTTIWPVNGLVVENCTAEDVQGPVLEIQSGDNSIVSGLRLLGSNSALRTPNVYIRYWDSQSRGTMTGHKVMNCELTKNANDYAIDADDMAVGDLLINDCQLDGYGVNSWIDQGSTEGPEFRGTYNCKNLVDPTSFTVTLAPATTDFDTTPYPDGAKLVMTAAGAETISDFSGGFAGKEFTLIINDANIGISSSSNLELDSTDGNYAAQAGGAVFKFVCIDGTNWTESQRRVVR